MNRWREYENESWKETTFYETLEKKDIFSLFAEEYKTRFNNKKQKLQYTKSILSINWFVGKKN